MPVIRRNSSLLICCIASACGAPHRDISLVQSFRPLSTLQGVHVGLRSHALLRLRPKLQPLPYVGYAERFVGNSLVTYWFALASDRPLGDSDLLVGVTGNEYYASEDSAQATWTLIRREMTQLGAIAVDSAFRIDEPNVERIFQSITLRWSADTVKIRLKRLKRSPQDTIQLSVFVGRPGMR